MNVEPVNPAVVPLLDGLTARLGGPAGPRTTEHLPNEVRTTVDVFGRDAKPIAVTDEPVPDQGADIPVRSGRPQASMAAVAYLHGDSEV